MPILMHRTYLLLAWLACWLSGGLPLLPAQTLRYDVIRQDESIGQMTVTRSRMGTAERIRSDMSVEVTFLITVSLRFTYEAEYERGRLVQALVRNYRNGTLRDETRIEQQADGQLRITRDGESETVAGPVQYTILQAYFQPPDMRQQVFSERWGRYQPFTLLEDGRYVMYVANGDKSYYTYQDGQCEEIELDMSLATLYLRRQP